MKNLIFTVIAVISALIGNAQNGGQYVENNSVKLQYSGFSAGNYYVTITNKKDCAGVFRYDYNGNTGDLTLAAFADTLINIGTSISGVIKAKSTAHCSGFNDNGWVELSLSITPLRFVKSSAEFLPATDEIKVDFTIADATNIDRIIIEVSIDGGKTYRQLGLAWPDPLQPNHAYSIKISANSVRGLKK